MAATAAFGLLLPLLALLAGGVVSGAILLALGIRGRAEFSEPRCARCHYDVRTLDFRSDQPRQCPECGADLRPRNAVRFVDFRRSPPLIIAGVILILLPAVLVLALLVLVLA